MTDDDGLLRADIRRLTTMLGQTLVRNEGQDLLDLVELVRGQAKKAGLADLPPEVDARLRAMDLATTIRLVRAFTSYFHLANVTEQVHRGRAALASRAERGGWIERARGELNARPKAAVVCGRRREVAPGASVYNRLADLEWDTHPHWI